MRRATRLGLLGWLRTLISIHALLAESDYIRSIRKSTTSNFYPRSPCGERHTHPITILVRVVISIHALLAESDFFIGPLIFSVQPHFYPRSPCGERLRVLDGSKSSIEISIHALLAESDSKPRRLKSRRCVFLSTLSLRRATY